MTSNCGERMNEDEKHEDLPEGFESVRVEGIAIAWPLTVEVVVRDAMGRSESRAMTLHADAVGDESRESVLVYESSKLIKTCFRTMIQDQLPDDGWRGAKMHATVGVGHVFGLRKKPDHA